MADGDRLASSAMRRAPIWHMAVCVVALGAATVRPCGAAVNRWSAVGTFGAPVVNVAVDPHRPGVIYASTDEHLFISRDDAATWTVADVDRGALSIAFDPHDSLTIYVATGSYGVGVYKSTDGGTTWTHSAPADYLIVYAVAVDPNAPGTVYAGTYRVSGSRATGVFKSTDGGHTWAPTGLNVNIIDTIAVANTHPTTLFAKARDAIFDSHDGGATWNRLDTSGLGILSACAIAVDPNAPATIYFGTEDGAVVRSTDGGKTGTALTAGLMAGSPCQVAIDPFATSTLYVGAERGVFKSTDSGQRWAPVDGSATIRPAHAIAVDPYSPGRLYVASETGLLQLDQRALFQCSGDCSGDDRITIDELIAGVAIALDSRRLTDCPRFDANGDGVLSIDELTAALVAALDGCAPETFSIALPDFGGFELRRESADGFCPPLDSVYGAQLFDGDESGIVVFYHDTLETGVAGVDQCVPNVSGGGCAVVRPHPMRTLTAAEAQHVRDVFGQITVHSRSTPNCGSIDPCLVNDFRWDRIGLSDAPCADRRIDAAQSAAIIDLLDALDHGGE